ncbi:hypothetical protein XENTR_v10017678 [Xenopus tropicalis]|nr:hypothetical protein XENTR_v10017678 [Xenopus tropicalis]
MRVHVDLAGCLAAAGTLTALGPHCSPGYFIPQFSRMLGGMHHKDALQRLPVTLLHDMIIEGLNISCPVAF